MTTFASTTPRQASFLVYINGIEVPAKAVSLRYGVWQVPEMSIEMTADPVLVRLGAEDRVQVAVFYLDDCDVAPGVTPMFRLFGEGEITAWGYRNTPGGRSIVFTVVNQIAIFSQLFTEFMTSVEDMVNEATSPSRDVNRLVTPSSQLIYPYALFTQGLLEAPDEQGRGAFIKRPFDFLYNTVRGMLDVRVPAAQQAIPAANFFARWARLTNFHNRFAASPFFDDPAASSDSVFPALRAVQGMTALDTVVKSLCPNIQNAGSMWDMIQMVYQTMLMEVAMIPSMPLVTTDLKTHLVDLTNFDEHRLVRNAAFTDQLLTVIGARVQTFGGTVITGLVNGHALAVRDGLPIDGVTGQVVRYVDTIEGARERAIGGRWMSAISRDSRKLKPKRLQNYFPKPQMLFSIPPTCNVIFPSQLLTVAYDENYATQPTRLYFNEGTVVKLMRTEGNMAQTVMDALAIGYPPEVDAAAHAHKDDSTVNDKNFLLYPEEFFKGPVLDRRTVPPWLFFLKQHELRDAQPTAPSAANFAPAADGSVATPVAADTAAAARTAAANRADAANVATPPPPTPAADRSIPLQQPGWVWPVLQLADGRAPEITSGFNESRGERKHAGVDIMYRRKQPLKTTLAVTATPAQRRAAARADAAAAAADFGSRNYEAALYTPIVAANKGVVTHIEPTTHPRGGQITIRHGADTYTVYVHLDSISVAKGQSVVAGQQIGTMGYGQETKIRHLHFQVHDKFGPGTSDGRNKTAHDPAPIMRTWQVLGAPTAAGTRNTAPVAATVAGAAVTPADANAPAIDPADALARLAQADDVYKLYARFEFFRERYATRSGAATLAWNPYIVPGFPAAIFDQRATRVDLLCYVTTVQQTMSHNGQRGTTVSFMYGRQFQEVFASLDQEFRQSDAAVRGTAPQEPLRDISRVVQSFTQSEEYYQRLFYGNQPLYNKRAAFDFRDVIQFAPIGKGDPEPIFITGPDAAEDDIVATAQLALPPLIEERQGIEQQLASLRAQQAAQQEILTRAGAFAGSPQAQALAAIGVWDVAVISQTTQAATEALATLHTQTIPLLARLTDLNERISTALVRAKSTRARGTRVAHNLGGRNADRELVPTLQSADAFNNYAAAMRYNWRPICTLDEYVIFYDEAAEGEVQPFGDAHSVGVRYFTRIRTIPYKDLPEIPKDITGLDSATATGLTPATFSSSRSPWDKILLAYRNNVLTVKAPRT